MMFVSIPEHCDHLHYMRGEEGERRVEKKGGWEREEGRDKRRRIREGVD